MCDSALWHTVMDHAQGWINGYYIYRRPIRESGEKANKGLQYDRILNKTIKNIIISEKNKCPDKKIKVTRILSQ